MSASEPPGVSFTDEQAAAVRRRSGALLLDAGAGSGKTAVLVERFVRAVLDDGVEVGRILAITFTEKAASELRERIRARLHEAGAAGAAREVDGAWISTIHAFCARVLRTHALEAGLDPAFAVLEQHEAAELARIAFDDALAESAGTPAGAELIAAHGPGGLRTAILDVHARLRSRGQRRPTLPEVLDPGEDALERARAAAFAAAREAAAQLGEITEPPLRVTQALDALERAQATLAPSPSSPPPAQTQTLWPGDVGELGLPARNGAAALATGACDAYRDALDHLRATLARAVAAQTRDALERLLAGYGERFAALKTARGAVDFEDLELLARELLARPAIGGPLRQRFAHVMVDELQDTNRVQLELVDLIAGPGDPAGSLFMVGDAQQSIYRFRHAEVELFEQRGREMEERGARASLQTNFRSRPQVLAALNAAFAAAIGEGYRPLRAGRLDPEGAAAGTPAGGGESAPVELLIVDKGAEWEADGLAAPWRLAEARALAARVRALLDAGECAVGDLVVLTRASTDLAAYERALEAVGVPTYVIGGRGYWSHPQVVELVSYLRALANPREQESWWTTLFSPLCGISLDGLVLLAAGARDELDARDRNRLERFEAWFVAEREAAARLGIETLLDRVLAHTGYDAAVLALPGGRRRLANVRKLMRIGREWESSAGPDLAGFVSLVASRAVGGAREGEAPVESESLDAVRLMTIHRAKGLEFPVVCVADLGRGPRYGAPLIRLDSRGARLGLRLARAGSGARIAALDYEALREEELAAEEAEERRLFYVAMTRARERLILSGAARMDSWEKGNRSTPSDWIVPAFVPDVAARTDEAEITTALGVRLMFIRADSETPSAGRGCPAGGTPVAEGAFEPEAVAEPGDATESDVAPAPLSVRSLSYSALVAYERCGYRFYAERVLGLPGAAAQGAGAGPAAQRGTLVHALLARLDFRHPSIPDDAPPELVALLTAFAQSPTRRRLAASLASRREQPFAFALGATGVLVRGTFDVLATERPGQLLVVDYKTGAVADYDTQRLIYAIAALRSGAARVEVLHVFLEAGGVATRTYQPSDLPGLEAALLAAAEGVLAGRFDVTAEPHRGVCAGCPALGGLCSWPAEVAMRPASDPRT